MLHSQVSVDGNRDVTNKMEDDNREPTIMTMNIIFLMMVMIGLVEYKIEPFPVNDLNIENMGNIQHLPIGC